MGLGTNIKIVGQPWLSDAQNPYVTSSSPSFGNHTVSNLMCVSNRMWDEEVIRDLFNERDQQCILNTVLNEAETEDCLYWSKENT